MEETLETLHLCDCGKTYIDLFYRMISLNAGPQISTWYKFQQRTGTPRKNKLFEKRLRSISRFASKIHYIGKLASTRSAKCTKKST